ncbi:uncharacterized protein LTR77_001303 [Saxophila tyrrhenica]|uniref:UDP-glucose 6-dehydrogenase n=1 Tax=Saxophila tyrrhenica TaxID=1690608 RepID=A0AAV9PK43_9PEZI|nr:hypothetical protein LTR77_001303 [Saxophila tyrrhenica]
MVRTVKNICCVGAGYVGGPTCAVVASKNEDVDVTVVDLSQPRIDAWNSSQLPIYEPGLQEIVEFARDGSDQRRSNLHFSTDVRGAIQKADLIFISVNTPTKTVGVGAGRAADIKYVEAAAREIAEVATSDKIIVEKSTVPCGTSEILRDIFEAVGEPHVRFDVLSNPEFLAEGTAIADLLSPDRILIGSEGTPEGLEAANALADVYAAWVPRERIRADVNIWSSELAKLAANCMLAQRISSINSLSAICEATGANIKEISHSVGLDKRIGPNFLKASIGFGGSCFKKDVLNLVYMAETLHLPEVASYWKAVVDINEWQKDRFAKHIIRALNSTVEGKRIAILGLAYKKNTGDTRESPAIAFIGQMLSERAQLAIYDPKVSYDRILRELGDEFGHEAVAKYVKPCESAYAACERASAVAIMTEWDEFKTDQLTPRPTLDLRDLTVSKLSTTPVAKRADSTSSAPSSQSEDNMSSDEEGRQCPSTPPTNTSSPTTELSDPTKPLSDGSTPTRLDWARISTLMRRPRLVFDGRNVVEAPKLRSLGFLVQSIGQRSEGLLRR